MSSTSEATPLKEEVDKKNDTQAEAVSNSIPSNYPKLVAIMSVILAIGTGLAFALNLVMNTNSSVYEEKITLLQSQDLQWLYLALVILGRTINFVNFVPTAYKKGLKGNIRSNPFFFQTNDERKTLVVFQDEGTKGMYNRSNRSIQHMVENFGAFLASIGPVGYLFPKQVCILVATFGAGRILHQKGYTQGYGKHAIGFVLSLLAIVTMEGLAMLAFLKAEALL